MSKLIRVYAPARTRAGAYAAALALAAPIMLAAASPAHAAPSEPSGVSVRYDDLDLSAEQGRKMLDQRVEKAARDVCKADARTRRSAATDRQPDQCYQLATAQLKRHFADMPLPAGRRF